MEDLIKTKILNNDSLIWREDFSGWKKLSNVPELYQLMRSVPPTPPTPPIPPAPPMPETLGANPRIGGLKGFLSRFFDEWMPYFTSSTTSALSSSPVKKVNSAHDHACAPHPLAGNWSRFFARVFDLWLINNIVVLWLSNRFSVYVDGFVDWLFRPGSDQIFAIACVPVSLMIDALIYKLFKNTPGKAMLGLMIVTDEGKKVEAGAYLHRNFSLWKN
ncbi:hypothetical protein CYR55_22640, partial [Chimaeribacter californicus]